MLSRDQLNGALIYNAKQAGKLYKLVDLPWPWCEAEPNSFVYITALFQSESVNFKGNIDGKLGPVTLGIIQKEIGDIKIDETIKDFNKQEYDDFESEYSNCIIVNGAAIELPDELVKYGITASNYLLDDEPRFKHTERNRELIHFVIHETCGNTAKGCKNTLLKKGYGVHLILSPYGHLSCHGDLVLDRMVHANQLNNTSIGIEVVNPYNPIYVIDDELWKDRIKKQWWTWVPNVKNNGINELLKKKGLNSVPNEYVLPTKKQMIAIKKIVPWICDIVGIPYRFPTNGLNMHKRKIDGLDMKPKGRPGIGVVAHYDFSGHSDGRFILEELIKDKK